MIDYYMMAMKRYVDFGSRSRRSEYWYFYLTIIIGSVLCGLVDGFAGLANEAGNGPFGSLFTLVHFLPLIAAGIRRMHDINHRGWWILVPIYNIFLLARNGDVGANRFGDDPKNPTQNVAETFN